MTAAAFRPSHVRFRYRHPGMIAHQLRKAMGTGQPVRIELRNGTVREGHAVRMTVDKAVKIADSDWQASNLTVHLDSGAPIKLDDIRAVGDAEEGAPAPTGDVEAGA